MYRSRRYPGVLPVALVLSIVSACGEEGGGTEPEPGEINVTIVSGDDQLGEPGLPLADPIVVRVVTRTGGAVQGQVVTFRVVSGRGSISASSVTSAADGRASTLWTLGAEGGENRVLASVGSASVTFQAFAETPNTVKGDSSPGLPGG